MIDEFRRIGPPVPQPASAGNRIGRRVGPQAGDSCPARRCRRCRADRDRRVDRRAAPFSLSARDGIRHDPALSSPRASANDRPGRRRAYAAGAGERLLAQAAGKPAGRSDPATGRFGRNGSARACKTSNAACRPGSRNMRITASGRPTAWRPLPRSSMRRRRAHGRQIMSNLTRADRPAGGKTANQSIHASPISCSSTMRRS